MNTKNTKKLYEYLVALATNGYYGYKGELPPKGDPAEYGSARYIWRGLGFYEEAMKYYRSKSTPVMMRLAIRLVEAVNAGEDFSISRDEVAALAYACNGDHEVLSWIAADSVIDHEMVIANAVDAAITELHCIAAETHAFGHDFYSDSHDDDDVVEGVNIRVCAEKGVLAQYSKDFDTEFFYRAIGGKMEFIKFQSYIPRELLAGIIRGLNIQFPTYPGYEYEEIRTLNRVYAEYQEKRDLMDNIVKGLPFVGRERAFRELRNEWDPKIKAICGAIMQRYGAWPRLNMPMNRYELNVAG